MRTSAAQAALIANCSAKTDHATESARSLKLQSLLGLGLRLAVVNPTGGCAVWACVGMRGQLGLFSTHCCAHTGKACCHPRRLEMYPLFQACGCLGGSAPSQPARRQLHELDFLIVVILKTPGLHFPLGIDGVEQLGVHCAIPKSGASRANGKYGTARTRTSRFVVEAIQRPFFLVSFFFSKASAPGQVWLSRGMIAASVSSSLLPLKAVHETYGTPAFLL